MRTEKLTLLVLPLLFSAACVSVQPDAGVSDVRSTVLERSGQSVAAFEPLEHERLERLLSEELEADDVVAIAMANNPRVAVELAELGVARSDFLGSRLISNPVFGIEYLFADHGNPLEMSLTKSIVDLIQLPRRRAAGLAAFDAAKIEASRDLLAFAAEVRDDYFDLLAASQHLAMRRTTVEATRLMAEIALRQHAAGNINDVELEQHQASYERAKLDLASAEEEALVARERMMLAMGLRDRSADWTIRATFPPLPEPVDGDLVALATERRLDLALGRKNVAVAEAARGVARTSVLEGASAGIHFEREDGETAIGPGVDLPIPIFDTGRAARMRAASELELAKRSLELAALEAESEVRTMQTRLDAARARVEYYRDVVLPRRERIVRLMHLEYNAMLVGVYQLLQAREQLVDAQREYIEAQRAMWLAWNDLQRAIDGVGIPQRATMTAGSAPAKPAEAGGGH